MEMFSANDAYELSTSFVDYKAQLEYCFSQIKEAAKSGVYSVRLYDTTNYSQEVFKTLKNLGYGIWEHFEYISVSWWRL